MTKKLILRRFLDTLPLPDNIGSAEYRALHELLSDLDSDDLDGNDLEVVDFTLKELAEWTSDVQLRLDRFREIPGRDAVREAELAGQRKLRRIVG